ncbi:uncharacterized protein LOC134542453 [Bacillus rossius redtenbacheri]|uniref:uncharacterized protein LOC134542453 n=2 Tax=Bacillus rossius redtenbacheri TaxID=93214 RepID=UPI002FDEF37E
MQHATNRIRQVCTGPRTRAERAPRTPRTARREPPAVGFFDEHKGIRRASVDVFAARSAHAANMEWSEEDMLGLIEVYRTHPVLWDPSNRDYYKKAKKMDAWRDIAVTVGQLEDECRKKMISLLSSYRREKSKEKNTIGTGKGTSEVYTSRWFAYESLKFLEGRDKPRPTMNTEPVIIEGNHVHQELNVQNEDQEFLSPSAPKRAKGRQQGDGTALLADAVSILQATAGKFNMSPEQSEIKTFCAYLSSKMATFSSATRLGVQHAVYDILMKADRGLFEIPTYNYGQGQLFHSNAPENYSTRMYMQQPASHSSTSSVYLPAQQQQQQQQQQQPFEPNLSQSSPAGRSPTQMTPHAQVTMLPSASATSIQTNSSHTISPLASMQSPLSHSSQCSDDFNDCV